MQVKRDNETLGDKILNIFAVNNKKKMKPLFEFKKTKQTQFNKYFVSRVEQDNLQMLKRLVDLPSNYDKKTWYKDFEKSQEYKKNICVFPSIKFLKDYESDRERSLHTSQQKKTIELKNKNLSAFNFSNSTAFFNSTKKRSTTSYSKFKDTERLYGSKYFQQTEDNST